MIRSDCPEMPTTMSSNTQILVCQHGARRRYAIPRMFEQAGILTAFYTDACAESPMGRCAAMLGQAGMPAMQRLAQRKPTGIPREKIHCSDMSNLYPIINSLAGRKMHGIRLFSQQYKILSRRMIQWGLQGANTVYSMYYENLDFVRWAKAHGARSVVDVFVSPQTNEIMRRESEAFPEWGKYNDLAMQQMEAELWKETAELADLLICPSEWVAKGVRAVTSNASSKIRVVSYGCSIDYNARINQPIEGRVLFAGNYALRKGLHYLAEAASRLKTTIPHLDVRIAGSLPVEVIKHPICKDLHFLGKLNAEEMKQEYLSADCFVLPSLSEGFAGVVAEALAAGCPVIVSEEVGSPVQNGREGLIVPACNADALAEAIKYLIEDRGFRQHCSSNCLKQIPFYSEAMWCERLVAAIDQES